jgi:multidrug transporter EmrE-like cation transporter
MFRERALKVVLVLFGLLFLAGLYPIVTSLSSKSEAQAGFAMLMSLYVALGVFLLLAARNPSAHRSLIAYAAWANIAHGAVMAAQAFEFPADPDFVRGAIAFVVIGSILLALAPPKQPAERPSTAVAA